LIAGQGTGVSAEIFYDMLWDAGSSHSFHNVRLDELILEVVE
jgi:hypothetical protein